MHPKRKLFVNLAVEDLDRSVEFFTKLGFSFDPRFTDETATCMLIGEDAYAMLLTGPRFADFTTRETADPRAATEAILAFAVESRDEVDSLADLALEAGAWPGKEPMDLGFMYQRHFDDPDGHHWEVFWMDPKAAEEGPAAAETPASA
jgi:uncharacterized protein